VVGNASVENEPNAIEPGATLIEVVPVIVTLADTDEVLSGAASAFTQNTIAMIAIINNALYFFISFTSFYLNFYS
jgi:hypothetical protein